MKTEDLRSWAPLDVGLHNLSYMREELGWGSAASAPGSPAQGRIL